MNVRHPVIRVLFPWVVLALVVGVFAGWIWPHQIRQILSESRRIQTQSEYVLPPDSMAVQSQRWARDTVRLHALLQKARDRGVAGTQATSALTAQLVDILEKRDWEIDQATASVESTHIAVRISAQLPYTTILRGLDAVERSPKAVQIQSLQIRPNGPWNDIQLELHVPRGDRP